METLSAIIVFSDTSWPIARIIPAVPTMVGFLSFLPSYLVPNLPVPEGRQTMILEPQVGRTSRGQAHFEPEASSETGYMRGRLELDRRMTSVGTGDGEQPESSDTDRIE